MPDPVNREESLPDKNDREVWSNQNGAYVSLVGRPGHAGLAFADVGYKFDITNGAYQWDEIKNLPVEIKFTYGYSLKTNWQLRNGSANAQILDFRKRTIAKIGGWSEADTPGNVSLSEHNITTINVTFADFKNKSEVYLTALCQVHVNKTKQSIHSSSAQIDMDRVDVTFKKLPSKTGELKVTSNPPGAVIKLNGKQKGISNTTIDIEPGAYVMSYELPGYEICTNDGVIVEAGQQTTYHCNLIPERSLREYFGWAFIIIGLILIFADRKKDIVIKIGIPSQSLEYAGPIGLFLVIVGVILSFWKDIIVIFK